MSLCSPTPYGFSHPTFIPICLSSPSRPLFLLLCALRGESYLDVIARIEPIIMEMERHREPLLIVGHQGTHRNTRLLYC